MAEKKQWKDHLLKSGIPFEYEIKKLLESKGCIVDFEFSYLRENENNQLKEFSFDLDATYISRDLKFFFALLVECKYRHESTQWVFLPDSYNGPKDVEYLDFLHLNEVFNAEKYFLGKCFPYPIAKLCSKGVEITKDGSNPKSIEQAISQLAFGVANKIVSQYDNHIDEVLKETFLGTIFSTIPIIVTTARLYRINDTIGMDEIKNSSEINEIATEESCVVLNLKKTIELTDYNRSIFLNYFKDKTGDQIRPIVDKKNTIGFFLEMISSRTPSCILVINYDKLSSGFDTLFEYLNKFINPDDNILKMIDERIKKIKDLEDELKKKKKVNNVKESDISRI